MNGLPQVWATLLALVPGRGVAEPPGLPEILNALPYDTPLAFHTPRLRDLADDLERLHVAVRPLGGREDEVSPSVLVPRLLWGVDAGTSPSPDHGVDLEGPAVLGLDPKLEVGVLVLPLASAPAFEAWLERLEAPSRARVRIDRSTVALVLGPGTRTPLGCVVQPRRAVCQLGAPSAGGIGRLQDMLQVRTPRLGQVPGLAESWRELGRGARWTALVRPVPFARALARRWGREMQRAHRLHDVSIRRDVARRARRVERLATSHAGLVDAVAVGVEADPSGGRVEVVARMTDRGRERLDRWLPETAAPSRIRSWVATPALASLFVQAEPTVAAEIARWAGVELPAPSLDGTLGVLAFGVDARCPHALPPGRGQLDWAFLVPSAATLGLRGPRAADQVHAVLDARIEADRDIASLVHRAPIHARVDGGEVAVHVLDDVLLVGTGPMSDHAALRRLEAPSSSSPARPRGFLHAALDLGATAAALEAAEVGNGHRAELRWLDRIRRRLSPLLQQMQRVQVSGVREAQGRQVRLELELGVEAR